jgi:hypothetical protein
MNLRDTNLAGSLDLGKSVLNGAVPDQGTRLLASSLGGSTANWNDFGTSEQDATEDSVRASRTLLPELNRSFRVPSWVRIGADTRNAGDGTRKLLLGCTRDMLGAARTRPDSEKLGHASGEPGPARSQENACVDATRCQTSCEWSASKPERAAVITRPFDVAGYLMGDERLRVRLTSRRRASVTRREVPTG